MDEDSDSKTPSPKTSARSRAADVDLDDTNKIEFQNLNIVTEESLKQMYLLDLLVKHQFPILLIGETGTGKTQVIKKFTSRLMQNKSQWEIGDMVLSATTTAS